MYHFPRVDFPGRGGGGGTRYYSQYFPQEKMIPKYQIRIYENIWPFSCDNKFINFGKKEDNSNPKGSAGFLADFLICDQRCIFFFFPPELNVYNLLTSVSDADSFHVSSCHFKHCEISFR